VANRQANRVKRGGAGRQFLGRDGQLRMRVPIGVGRRTIDVPVNRGRASVGTRGRLRTGTDGRPAVQTRRSQASA
jgi:hypothetical protein